jgi:signal transduction histidine kinase
MNMPNISFGIALALLGGISLLSYQITRSLAEAAEGRHRALLRLDQLHEVLAAAMDVETGERGYVITGDPKFLEPYESGIERLGPQLQGLRAALADDPRQQPALAILEEATAQLRQYDGHVVSLKMSKEDSAAQSAVAAGRGKQIMDHVRQLIAGLRAEEREQLQQREEQFQTGLRWSMFGIVAGSLVGFAAVGLAAVMVNRSLRARARLNVDLRQALVENTEMLDRLRVTGADLLRSNQELEQFAYVASHDLQEPLRKVSSFAQLLATRYQGKLDGDADEFIGYMVDGVQRMQALIQNLLAYSRLGRKGQPFAITDSNAILKQSLSNLQGAIEESGAVVTTDLLPTVLADGTQLVQLFQNLIGNAIKFHGPEKPLIHVRAESNGPEWSFSVRDNGIGIDRQYAERIFVIFQRLHSRAEYPGTGIGLAFCKKIVERHGGRIWLGPEPGPGATFWFTLPRTADANAATNGAIPENRRAGFLPAVSVEHRGSS